MSDEATVTRPTATRRTTDVVPMLTIVAHPNPNWVPSELRLDSTVEVSRVLPAFTRRSDGQALPLADRYLSRSPIVFKPEREAVWVLPGERRIEIVADGVPLLEPTRFDHAALERGVVLMLHGRIVLLLHLGVDRRTGRAGDTLGLEGCSDAIERVRHDIRTVGELSVPVLIRGESGTGKELIARAIHRESPRAGRAYEALNMATLSASLAASELFGHVRGAFTGADRNHIGCFMRCDGGTLFLDEIGETPIDTQAQLLRVLETCDVRPVGGSASKTVDVRVIAATDADLEGAVHQGSFREALLQRLAGFRIVIPPLRERRVDIGPLIYHFARLELSAVGMTGLLDASHASPGGPRALGGGEAQRIDEMGGPEQPWISAPTVARLIAYHWPGNVRELRNIVRQLVIAGRRHVEMSLGSDLDTLLRPTTKSPVPALALEELETVAPRTAEPARSHYRMPAEIDEDELIAVLRANGYRLAAAAKALNLSRTSLYALVEQSSRIRKASDLSAEQINEALGASANLPAAATALEVSAHALKLRMRALGIAD